MTPPFGQFAFAKCFFIGGKQRLEIHSLASDTEEALKYLWMEA